MPQSKEDRNAYQKEWRKNNPLYTESNNIASKKWRINHPEECKAFAKKWRINHPEECKAFAKEWDNNNWDKRLRFRREWGKKNKNKISFSNKDYRSRIKITVDNINDVLSSLPKEVNNGNEKRSSV